MLYLPRFSGENRDRNQRLIDALQTLASERRCHRVTVGDCVSPRERCTHRAGDWRAAHRVAGRTGQIQLSAADVARLEEAVPASAVAGTRYDEHQMRILDSER